MLCQRLSFQLFGHRLRSKSLSSVFRIETVRNRFGWCRKNSLQKKQKTIRPTIGCPEIRTNNIIMIVPSTPLQAYSKLQKSLQTVAACLQPLKMGSLSIALKEGNTREYFSTILRAFRWLPWLLFFISHRYETKGKDKQN